MKYNKYGTSCNFILFWQNRTSCMGAYLLFIYVGIWFRSTVLHSLAIYNSRMSKFHVRLTHIQLKNWSRHYLKIISWIPFCYLWINTWGQLLSAKGKEPQPKVTERFIYVSLLSKFVRPGLYLYVADMNNCLGLSRKIVILNSSKPPTPREGKQIEVLPICYRVLS
jgi:hypothetical protein